MFKKKETIAKELANEKILPAEKEPQERKHQCSNKMLECINSYEHLSVNGSKDSQYNDLISFEKNFNEWDYNLIVLERMDYGHEGGNDGRPYVYITIQGIFDHIGMFARHLQHILPTRESGKTISVMDFGGDLNISIHDGSHNPFTQPTYIARTMKLNQEYDRGHKEGHKWHITKI